MTDHSLIISMFFLFASWCLCKWPMGFSVCRCRSRSADVSPAVDVPPQAPLGQPNSAPPFLWSALRPASLLPHLLLHSGWSCKEKNRRKSSFGKTLRANLPLYTLLLGICSFSSAVITWGYQTCFNYGGLLFWELLLFLLLFVSSSSFFGGGWGGKHVAFFSLGARDLWQGFVCYFFSMQSETYSNFVLEFCWTCIRVSFHILC